MIKAAPLRGTASGAPRAGLSLGEARQARPRRPQPNDTSDLAGSFVTQSGRAELSFLASQCPVRRRCINAAWQRHLRGRLRG